MITGPRAPSGPLRLVLAVSVLAALASSCTAGSPAQVPGVVRVVAGENVWGNVIAQIGGVHARVVSLIADPNADPHLYQAGVQDALEVAEASLVVENGAGYDDFVSRLVSATHHSGRVVVSVQRVLGAGGGATNPHFWYQGARVPEVAAAVERSLAGLDPADASYFAANLDRFDRSLAPLEAVVTRIRDRFAGAPVAYTERVPAYLVAEAGLADVTPHGFAASVEDGNDPSPADTAAMTHLIDSRAIRALLYNEQATSPAASRVRGLAAAHHIAVVGVTESLPLSFATYQAWQAAQARAILAALEG